MVSGAQSVTLKEGITSPGMPLIRFLNRGDLAHHPQLGAKGQCRWERRVAAGHAHGGCATPTHGVPTGVSLQPFTLNALESSPEPHLFRLGPRRGGGGGGGGGSSVSVAQCRRRCCQGASPGGGARKLATRTVGRRPHSFRALMARME